MARWIGRTGMPGFISATGASWLADLGYCLSDIPALARGSHREFTIPSVRNHIDNAPMLRWCNDRWLFSKRASGTFRYDEAEDGKAWIWLHGQKIPKTVQVAVSKQQLSFNRIVAFEEPVMSQLDAPITLVEDFGFTLRVHLHVAWHHAPSPYPRPRQAHYIRWQK